MIKSPIWEDTDQFCEFEIKVVEIIGGVDHKEDDSVLFFGLKVSQNVREWFGHDETVAFGDSKDASLEPELAWKVDYSCLVVDLMNWWVELVIRVVFGGSIGKKRSPILLFPSQ